MSALYEKDFYAWCSDQAQKLKSGQTDLDFANLAEEIDSLGRQWRNELVSRLKILFQHLLKWHYSSSDIREWHKNSWLASIRCQQREIPEFLESHPSLRASMEEDLAKAYKKARFDASIEGRLVYEDLPVSCPFSLEDALKEGWLPGDRY